jgi:hypothetical protein
VGGGGGEDVGWGAELSGGWGKGEGRAGAFHSESKVEEDGERRGENGKGEQGRGGGAF